MRDALFNSLGPGVAGAAVLDLFAGTGALGLEALRRGAARTVFVEHDPRRARAITERVRTEGFARVAEVRCQDATVALRDLVAAGARFALVVLDPPYGAGRLTRAVAAVVESGILAPGAVLVCEGHWRDRPELPEGLAVTRQARYGETALWFIRAGDRP